MANNVQVGFEANGEQSVAKAWEKVTRSEEDAVRALAKIAPEASRAQRATKGFFDSALGDMGKFVLGAAGVGSVLGGIATVAGVIKAEYQNLLDLQKSAAERQISTAGAQRAAIANLGDDPSLNVAQYNAEVQRISQATGVSQKDIHTAGSAALSARGTMTAKQAMASVEAAAMGNPFDPQGITETAQAIIDLQKSYGGSGTEVAGIMMATKQASRVVSDSMFAKNASPAIKMMSQFGDGLQEASALYATITQSMGDQSGAESGTAMIQIAKQLAEDLPQFKSTTERLAFINSKEGEAIRAKMMGTGKDKLNVEAKAYTTARGLINGDATDEQDRTYRQFMGDIPGFAGGEQKFNKLVGIQNDQNIQKVANLNQQFSAADDAAALIDFSGGSTSVINEGMNKALNRTGAGFFERNAASAEFGLNRITGELSPAELAARKLEARKSAINPQESEQARVNVELLNKLIAELRGLKETITENNDATKENTIKADKPVEVKVKSQRPINAPPKTPASAAVATR